MNILLVDTSVWVNFFKGNPTKASLYLKDILSNTLIATCPVIVQEVLQGIKTDKDFKITVNFFDEVLQLRDEPYQLSIEAATIYRKLRHNGITIRKPNDCLIAAYAIKNKIALLHDDRDFDFIASNTDLEAVQF
ncbi:type II toxin-antitoxin system VapC family toxin [Mucilaginibacter boryungensis]|uniref:Ribonuclease VapC n=1 Tax=Mucilaginibacter boryungensis TaxID=768480 RepID=A0ABR9XEU2_9SPHI|nr:PIN domain-containing protein [Mucilaginibacter boryungensis]MBE9665898.1 PIN domain-containing protein [Mucilaginibacter boryungensis]